MTPEEALRLHADAQSKLPALLEAARDQIVEAILGRTRVRFEDPKTDPKAAWETGILTCPARTLLQDHETLHVMVANALMKKGWDCLPVTAREPHFAFGSRYWRMQVPPTPEERQKAHTDRMFAEARARSRFFGGGQP